MGGKYTIGYFITEKITNLTANSVSNLAESVNGWVSTEVLMKSYRRDTLLTISVRYLCGQAFNRPAFFFYYAFDIHLLYD